MSSKVINIGVADVAEAEAKLNEELKKIEGYTGHTVTFNGFNDVMIVFATAETSDGADEVEDGGEDEGEGEETTTYIQAKILCVPLDQEEAQAAIDAALEGLTLVSSNAISTIGNNRLLIVYQVTEEAEAETEEDPKEPADDNGGGGQ